MIPKKLLLPCLLVALLVLMAGNAFGREDTGYKSPIYKAMLDIPRRNMLNINLIAHWIYADGISAHDPNTNANGIYFPRGTYDAGVIYTDGLLWGGMVKDGQQPELRVGGTAYATGLIQGAIKSKGVAEDPDNDPLVRIYRIRKDYATADLKQDVAEQTDGGLADVTDAEIAALREQYRKDWEQWPWQKGAPFYDTNNNGIMDAGEEPGMANADQVVWFVANDLNGTRTKNLYGADPIGFEVQVTLWGYNRTDALGNVAFKRYKVIYKGTDTTPSTARVDSMFFAMFSDPDLGESSDDYMGCDTDRNMMFVYNSVSLDVKFASYKLAPAAAGYDFLQGPVLKTGNPEDVAIFGMKKITGFKNLGMSAFSYFAAGSAISDPDQKSYEGTRQWYNLMNGLLPRSNESFTDNNNVPTKFPMNGDPVAGTGDLDGNKLPAGDRRGEMITGPFSLALGDTQEVVIAVVCGMGADRLSSVSVMKYNDTYAQYAYDNFFELAKPPVSPKLSMTNMNKKILLNWGWDAASVKATEEPVDKGFAFEGYNLYQLPTASSTFADAKKLATFDVTNEVTTILDDKFDIASGQILKMPAQIGKNTGIERLFTVTKDAFTGKSLVNGNTYYFAVTAYNNNSDPNVPFHSMETAMLIKNAVPQTPNPGVRYPSQIGDTLKVTHKSGSGEGTAQTIVIDPTMTTGHKYDVIFDTTEGNTVWNLVDMANNKKLLSNQTDQEGTPSLVLDGFTVAVSGPPPGVKPDDANSTDDKSKWGWDIPSGTRRWTWAGGAGDYGLEGFGNLPAEGGGGALGDWQPAAFWGSGYIYPPLQLKPVLLKLAKVDKDGKFDPSDENVSYGYRYLRGASNPPAKPEFAPFIVKPNAGYAYQDYQKGVPLSAWDISDPNKPRRLQVGHFENNVEGGLVDGKYWPPVSTVSNTDAAGPKEWLFIYDLDYSETPNPTCTVEATTDMPIMYSLLGARRSATVGYSPGGTGQDQFAIYPTKPNALGDVFEFETQAPTYSTEKAKVDVEKINVYPNPYYGSNPRERTTVDRFVSFNHMPQKATIRIFDLAGTLVRTLEKDDETQFLRWDLLNHNNLPVASGIYIIHIEMKVLGKVKILKLALVREAEFLQVY